MITLSANFLAGINNNPAMPLTFSIHYSLNGSTWTELTEANGIVNIESLSSETEMEPFDFVGPDVEVICQNKSGFWTNPAGTGLLDTGARVFFRIRTANTKVSTEWVTHIQGAVDLATTSIVDTNQVSFVVRGSLNLLDTYYANEATSFYDVVVWPRKFGRWLKIDSIVAGHDEGLFPLTFDAEKKTLQWNYGIEVDVPEAYVYPDTPLELTDYLGNTLKVWAWQKQHIMEAGTPDEWYVMGKMPEEDVTQWILIRDHLGTLKPNQPGIGQDTSTIIQGIEDLTGVDIADHAVFMECNDRDKAVAPIDDYESILTNTGDAVQTDLLGVATNKWWLSISGNTASRVDRIDFRDGSASVRGGYDGGAVISTGYGLSPMIIDGSAKVHGARHAADYHRDIMKTIKVTRLLASDGSIEKLSNDIDAFYRSLAVYDTNTYYLLKHTSIGKSKLYKINALGTEGTPAHTETLTKNWTINTDTPCMAAACIANGFYVAAAEASTPSSTNAPPDAFGEGSIGYKLLVYDIANALMYKIAIPFDDIKWDEDNVYKDAGGVVIPVITRLIDGGGDSSFSVLATIGQVYRTGDYNDVGWQLKNTKQKLIKINVEMNISTLFSGAVSTGFGATTKFVFLGSAGADASSFIGKTCRFTSGSNSGMGSTIKYATAYGDSVPGGQPIYIELDQAMPNNIAADNLIIEDFYIQKTVREYIPKEIKLKNHRNKSKLIDFIRPDSRNVERPIKAISSSKTITEDQSYELVDSDKKTLGEEVLIANAAPFAVGRKIIVSKATIYEFNEATQKPDFKHSIPVSQDGAITAAAYDPGKDHLLYATDKTLFWMNITGQNYDFASLPCSDFDDLSCRDVLQNIAVMRNAIILPSEHNKRLTFRYRGASLAFEDFELLSSQYRYDHSYRPYFNYTGIEIDGYFLGVKTGLVLSLTCGLVQPAFKRSLALEILTNLYAGNRLHRVETDWQIQLEPGDNGVLNYNDGTLTPPADIEKYVMVLGVETDINRRVHALTLLEM